MWEEDTQAVASRVVGRYLVSEQAELLREKRLEALAGLSDGRVRLVEVAAILEDADDVADEVAQAIVIAVVNSPLHRLKIYVEE